MFFQYKDMCKLRVIIACSWGDHSSFMCVSDEHLLYVAHLVLQLLCGMYGIMKECWYYDSTARTSAVFNKMKLYQLAKEEKINFEHDDH